MSDNGKNTTEKVLDGRVSSSERILEVENLNVFYGAIQALHGISFHVNKGEIVTLIGANGAGKTTTLRTISGLQRPHPGKVVFMGEDITWAKPHEIVKKGIVHVPEGRRIFSALTVKENLEMGAFIRNDPKAIKESMEKVFEHFPRLKERLGQLGGTLSGGEQQMLAIGRALMSDPKLLLLDEPSMGLAPILVDEIFEILQDINARGVSVLLVEQNARKALSIADRGYVLETGYINIQGNAEELSKNPRVKEAYLGGA